MEGYVKFFILKILFDRENKFGQIDSIKVNGRIIKWRATESSPGQTTEDMKVNISTTKKRARVFSIGQTEESMTVNGKTESNMESEFTPRPPERLKRANGLKGKE